MIRTPESGPHLTTKVTVTCSFCDEVITVPFRHGAVMPNPASDQGVHCFVPRLDGGTHRCESKRHKDDRRHFLAFPRMAPNAQGVASE